MKPQQIECARKMNWRTQMRLREIRKVTEYRDGCVFRTKSLGFMCIADGYPIPEGIQVCSLSTKWSIQICRP